MRIDNATSVLRVLAVASWAEVPPASVPSAGNHVFVDV
jgi:hypothetical protein